MVIWTCKIFLYYKCLWIYYNLNFLNVFEKTFLPLFSCCVSILGILLVCFMVFSTNFIISFIFNQQVTKLNSFFNWTFLFLILLYIKSITLCSIRVFHFNHPKITFCLMVISIIVISLQTSSPSSYPSISFFIFYFFANLVINISRNNKRIANFSTNLSLLSQKDCKLQRIKVNETYFPPLSFFFYILYSIFLDFCFL